MCVYKLEPEFNEEGNSKYRHFGPGDYHPEIKHSIRKEWFCGQPIRASWFPLQMKEEKHTRHLPFPDFDNTVHWPMFSRQAVDVLADMLEPNGEVLPLICAAGEYFAYNVTRLVNVLDTTRCNPDRDNFRKLVFKTDCLDGLSIFTMKSRPWTHVLVTDLFIERVQQAELRGFNFRRLPNS